MNPIRWGILATGNVVNNVAQALSQTANSLRVALTRWSSRKPHPCPTKPPTPATTP